MSLFCSLALSAATQDQIGSWQAGLRLVDGCQAYLG